MRTIAIGAAKGGTGKTTTAVHLAHALSLAGFRVLLVDCDPRRHAALQFGLPPEPGLAAWLQGLPARAVEVRAGLRILDSGGVQLAALEHEAAASTPLRERFRMALQSLPDTDFVLLDCASGSSVVGEAALAIAGEILLPVSADYLSLASARTWLEEWAARSEATSSGPRPVRLLTTFLDGSRASARHVEAVLAQLFAPYVLQTRIHDSDELRDAAAHHGTVFDCDPLSRGALDHALLAGEILAVPPSTPESHGDRLVSIPER